MKEHFKDIIDNDIRLFQATAITKKNSKRFAARTLTGLKSLSPFLSCEKVGLLDETRELFVTTQNHAILSIRTMPWMG